MIPGAAFVGIAAVPYAGLGHDHEILPSPLIGKPAPRFDLPALEDQSHRVSNEQYAGRMHVLNVWATWCPGCHQEHSTLLEIGRRGEVPIVGVDWRDDRDAARRWLAELGNPYVATAFDGEGRLAIDLGVYMAPETFLVDDGGRIVHKHFGPLTIEAWNRDFVPLIAASR
jgi:cytochrome c biogenesis protein CcmG, thiol:disulfide interchange protein DsbE